MRKIFCLLLAFVLLFCDGCLAFAEQASESVSETESTKDSQANTLPEGADRSVAITNESFTVSVGKPLTITATVTPLKEGAPQKSVLEWSSSDESIATVNQQGVVKAVAPGSVEIVCQIKDNPEIKAFATISVIQQVKSITTEKSRLLVLGGSEEAASGTLEVTIQPENATEKAVLFSSSDESIVTVDETGKLHALAAGKAVITVTSKEEGSKAKAVCNVTVGQAVGSISLTSKETVHKKKSITLKPTIEPSNATNKTVEYSSSNEAVATVSKTGVVKAVDCGNATITCKATDGSGVSAACEVTVIQPVTGISSSEKKIVLFQGQSKYWNVSIKPADATTKALNYSSADSYTASVSSSGEISGKTAGKTTVTAETTDGSKKKTKCNVIVEPSVPISLDSIGHGIFNYNLLGLTVTNKCSSLTIVDFDFDMKFYNYGGELVNGGSFSLGSKVKLGPRKKKTIKRTVYGSGQAYKTVITITGVKFSDGSYWSIPYDQQETWSFTRN